jgi:hypothetical protein
MLIKKIINLGIQFDIIENINDFSFYLNVKNVSFLLFIWCFINKTRAPFSFLIEYFGIKSYSFYSLVIEFKRENWLMTFLWW